MPPKLAHPGFRRGVALGRRIRNPEVQLKYAVSSSAHFASPCLDRFRLHQERDAAAEATGIGDRNLQRRRNDAGHRGEQDGKGDAVGLGKGLGTTECGWSGQLNTLDNQRHLHSANH